MNAIKLLCFFLALPALACLAHDGYLYYLNTESGKNLPFQFSDLGWLWVAYSPESFAAAREWIDPGVWSWINLALEQTGAFLFGGIAALVYAALGLCWLLGVWPFARIPTTARGNLGLPDERRKGPIKYKRK